MKFITTAKIHLENKKLGISLDVRPVSNAMRFEIYDIGVDESLVGRIKLAEYIYNNCITMMSVDGTKIKPTKMIGADLTDTGTSDIYFEVVNMVATELLGSGDGAEEEADVKS